MRKARGLGQPVGFCVVVVGKSNYGICKAKESVWSRRQAGAQRLKTGIDPRVH